ncbi:MAG TPA: hypothetical protein DGH68_10765 [Bacteroidetes bacterium]|nr:hypothetical protein [Bacteroidota bacterium]
MQTILTVVFLGFIVGSLCNVVASLLPPPGPAVRLRRRGLRRRSTMKMARAGERRAYDASIVG